MGDGLAGAWHPERSDHCQKLQSLSEQQERKKPQQHGEAAGESKENPRCQSHQHDGTSYSEPGGSFNCRAVALEPKPRGDDF